jgi:hypothetical protein
MSIAFHTLELLKTTMIATTTTCGALCAKPVDASSAAKRHQAQGPCHQDQ